MHSFGGFLARKKALDKARIVADENETEEKVVEILSLLISHISQNATMQKVKDIEIRKKSMNEGDSV
ncbi:MAG: hypothetical protein WBA22_05395 [Candidatus Methanofastidiosia archaeon]